MTLSDARTCAQSLTNQQRENNKKKRNYFSLQLLLSYSQQHPTLAEVDKKKCVCTLCICVYLYSLCQLRINDVNVYAICVC